MKYCPSCNEILGDSVETCFSCRYNFVLKKKINNEENKKIIQLKRQVEEQKIATLERIEKEKIEMRQKNAIYEYEVVVLSDKSDGSFDIELYRKTLKRYSENGWRLKNIFTNEVGKNSSQVSYGGISVGSNSTMDQTIITFERCISPSQF